MYAKDYEHKENKTNEGNDIYLLFYIVIDTNLQKYGTKKMVY